MVMMNNLILWILMKATLNSGYLSQGTIDIIDKGDLGNNDMSISSDSDNSCHNENVIYDG